MAEKYTHETQLKKKNLRSKTTKILNYQKELRKKHNTHLPSNLLNNDLINKSQLKQWDLNSLQI